MTNNRDDFPLAVVRTLGLRAGHICSNPSCGQSTSGPADDDDSAINVGVAAHITAAATGGPRYDASLTSEQRKSATNGLWACQTCGKLIDSDDSRFPVQRLREWKARVEHAALERLNAGTIIARRVAVLERTLVGHANFVWDVAVTPDGRRVLSASNDKTVRMWDAASGNLIAVFGGHDAFVCSVAVSPSGNRMATGAMDGAVKVWDLARGVAINDINHGAADAKVAWRHDFDQIVSGGADGRLRLWCPTTGTCHATFTVHGKPILKVAVLDDDRLVSVSADQTARVCQASTGACVRTFDGHTGEVNSVAVMNDNRRMVSASEDCTLRIWDVETGECEKTLRGHKNIVWRVAVSPDCQLIASGAADNLVRLWDAASAECIQELPHPDCVAAVAFSADGSKLAVGCDDACVYLYKIDCSATEVRTAISPAAAQAQ